MTNIYLYICIISKQYSLWPMCIGWFICN